MDSQRKRETEVKRIRDGGTKENCRVTRKDRNRNDDIMTKLGLTMDIIDRIQQKWLRYFGHVVRMKNSRLPKIVLYGRMNGTRPREDREKDGWTTSERIAGG